ncbi:MAG: AAA family ATPase [Gemmatimonadota bacterium]|nr:AAA family ATPase [Gemmatimonadota bacterium]
MSCQPRVVDQELTERFAATGAVVLEGPKTCGKTVTARHHAASEVLLDADRNARRMVGVDPGEVLRGKTPRLIDEWQTEPDIWNHVRRAVDDRGAPGQFILTGSAVPADDITRHTGAGRLTRLRMRPFSLFETHHSSGEISLRRLLDGTPQRSEPSELPVSELVELLCRGGCWPAHLGYPLARALRMNRDYLNEIRRVDISRVSGRQRDPVKVGRLLRSLARNVATPASLSTLITDVRGGGRIMKWETASEYLEALEQLMIVEDLPA